MSQLGDPTDFMTNEDGIVPEGAVHIAFYNNGTHDEEIGGVMVRVGPDAIINGVPLKVGKATNYGFIGKPYRAIAYQCNGTNLFIRISI